MPTKKTGTTPAFVTNAGAFTVEPRETVLEPEQPAAPDGHGTVESLHRPERRSLPRNVQKFSGPPGPQFALTWQWPAFVFEPFLWFLYRKMYGYALIYAIGPAMAFYITQDLSADIVWRISLRGPAPTTSTSGTHEGTTRQDQGQRAEPTSKQQMLGGGWRTALCRLGRSRAAGAENRLVVTMLKDGPPDGPKGAPGKPSDQPDPEVIRTLNRCASAAKPSSTSRRRAATRSTRRTNPEILLVRRPAESGVACVCSSCV